MTRPPPAPMISVDEGKARIAALINPVDTETVPLSAAGGRVLRAPVEARRNQPPFAASAMDGYAIRQADLVVGGQLDVIGEIAAGSHETRPIGPGQAMRIFTGAPMPDGADYVLIQEDADRVTDAQGDRITIRADHDTTPYVRPAGGDFAVGHRIASPQKLGPSEIGLIAAMNVPDVTVSRRPVVALIATGDELIWPGETPRKDQIVASNNFALKAMFDAQGADARLLPIAGDTTSSLRAVFDLAADADLIVTMGGASVGDHDLVQTVATDRGLDLSFYKMAMRPGKPLMAGRMGDAVMIGLPGNPVSSIVCAHIFVKPAIDALLGLGFTPTPIQKVVLARDIGPNGPREHYLRATVAPRDGILHCTPHARQDSSLLSVLSASNALMIRPANDPAQTAGSEVAVTFL